jgi:hypothetical protein
MMRGRRDACSCSPGDLVVAIAYDVAVRGLVALVLVAGCDSVFRLDPVRLPDPRPDAAFNADTDCPPQYDKDLFPGSRYRVVGPGTAATLNATCVADTADQSHLAVLDTISELAGIQRECDNANDQLCWVGGVQSPAATQTTESWLWLTGESIPSTFWNVGEPNDFDGMESGQETFASVWEVYPGIVDVKATDTRIGICECDGRPMDPTAQSYIDALR